MKSLLLHIGEAFALAVLSSAILTGIAVRILRHRAILDRPNARSLHTQPTPRGGGWAIVLTMLPAWLWADARAGTLTDPAELLLVLGTAALIAVSWIDDRRGLSARIRLIVQAASVALVLAALPRDLTLSHGMLPLAIDRLVAAGLWLWFVNLFNFMDGIDGLAGGSAVAMGLGVMLVSLSHGPDELNVFRGAIIAGAAFGFLLWNWQPAKIFLGDVGSVPLGYLLGFELVRLAMDGNLVPALIIALYYLADATITLLRRLGRGERVWEAHREHFYQRAVQAGRSHALVSEVAILVQLELVLLALLATSRPWVMAPIAACLVLLLLRWMTKRPPVPR
jgi:UDP-N-acetylmuramyl pentapeptide phosphotransferase/UDP-N-acetylglucosamine-1-phosphate transferase